MKYSKEEMMGMYRTMIRARIYDETLEREDLKGHITSFVHQTIGQEAIGTAEAHALAATDVFMPPHRNAPLRMHRCDVYKYMSEYFGSKAGYNHGMACELHLNVPEKGFLPKTSILGSGEPICAGYAFALKQISPGKVILRDFGDGAFTMGVVHEAISWVAMQQLPIVYVVQNNQWCSYTPSEYYRNGEDISAISQAVGLRTVTIENANDVLVVREVMDEAIALARKNIPTLVEAKTYRIKGHHTGDTGTYRPKEYVEAMLKKYPDPIISYEKVLVENVVATQEELDLLKSETVKEFRAIAKRVYQERKMPEFTPTAKDVEDIKLVWEDPMEGLR